MSGYMPFSSASLLMKSFQEDDPAVSSAEARKRKTQAADTEYHERGTYFPVASCRNVTVYLTNWIDKTLLRKSVLAIPGVEARTDSVTVGLCISPKSPMAAWSNENEFIFVAVDGLVALVWRGNIHTEENIVICIPLKERVLQVAINNKCAVFLTESHRVDVYDYQTEVTNVPVPEKIMLIACDHGRFLMMSVDYRVFVCGTDIMRDGHLTFDVGPLFQDIERDYNSDELKLSCNEDVSLVCVANPYRVYLWDASGEIGGMYTMCFPTIQIKTITMSGKCMYYAESKGVSVFNTETRGRDLAVECTRPKLLSVFAIPEQSSPVILCVSSESIGSVARVSLDLEQNEDSSWTDEEDHRRRRVQRRDREAEGSLTEVSAETGPFLTDQSTADQDQSTLLSLSVQQSLHPQEQEAEMGEERPEAGQMEEDHEQQGASLQPE